jgi:sigma-B regulation protein RsbU (phosphoserine phosphatase)
MPTLEIIRGMNAGHCFEITGRECVIGREMTCAVVIPSRTVSREHARILNETDGYYLEDMRSINGTAVNGQKIERRTLLHDSDLIAIFDTVLRFSEATPEAAPESPATTAPQFSAKPSESSVRILSQQPILREIDVNAAQEAEADGAAAKKLDAVLQIARNLGNSLDVDAMLSQILESLFEIFPHAQRGYILQAKSPGAELSPTAIKHRNDVSDTISPISNTVALRVMNEGTAFLSGDVLSDDRLEEIESSIFDEPVRSIMCAPLIGPSKTPMGVVHLETGNPREPFSTQDLEVLVSVGFMGGQALEIAKLHESLSELELRRREITLAKDVQLRFLPTNPPRIPGYKFYQHYLAADSVAGDYYDYIKLPDGRLAIVQGDVSGKGISAALLVARLCSDVRYCLLASNSPVEAMTLLNKQVVKEVQNNAFVTMALCILDPRDHQVSLVNAGHPYPMLRRHGSDDVEVFDSAESSMPLGVMYESEFRSRSFGLGPGDVFICYTDGVSESANPEGKLYEIPAVRDVVARTNPDPRHIGQALLADVRHFAAGHLQTDDICIVAFGRDADA